MKQFLSKHKFLYIILLLTGGTTVGAVNSMNAVYSCRIYSGWVQIFVESWRWPSEIISVVLNFMATSEFARMRSQVL